jgi:hypothetical protein
MKNVIKYSIAALMLGFVSVAYGQTPPGKVTLDDGKDYYKHGNNSTGENLPREERDSVTVTSVIKYFVLPDPAVSPEYKYDTPANTVDFTNVKSSFDWTLRYSLGGSATNNSTTPIITVTWGNTEGVDSVKVIETPAMGGACAGKHTVIPVAVIKKPEIGFTPNGTIYRDSACYSQAQVATGINRQFAMLADTRSSHIEVDYTVKKDGASASLLDGSNVRVVNGNITLKFTEYGQYEITITKVTDRISRKSTDASGNPITGIITSAGTKFTYTVVRPAQTGPIYRIPNNF